MGILDRVRGALPKGELRQAILTLVGGASLAQAIVILSAPVITRLYSPSEVGAYSVASAILSVLIVVTCLRYEWAIPLPGSDVAAANVLALCVIVAIVVSIVSGIVLWLVGPALLGFLGASEAGPWVLLIVLGQLAGGLVLAFTGWAIRTKQFTEIAANRLTQSGALVTAQIGLGVLRFGAVGMLFGSVAGQAAGGVRLGRAAWRTHASAFRAISWEGIGFAARRYRRFPIFSSGSAVLNSLGEQAPLLLVVALYGTVIGGEYALAVRVSALPVSLVAAAVAQVFVAETARLVREDPPRLRTMFGRTTRMLAVLALAPAALLAILAPILTGPLFGEAWHDAGWYVAILTPMFYLQLVTSATGGTLDVLERQDLHLLREILRLVFVGGAAVICAVLHLAPLAAIAVFSVAGCLTYLAYGLASWRAIIGQASSGPRGS